MVKEFLLILALSVSGVGGQAPVRDVKQIQTRIEQDERLKQALKEIEMTLTYSSQIKVLDLQYKEHALSIDLSKELLAYGGGNAAEQYIGEVLFKWAFTDATLDEVTLLVEGKANAFPEGNDFSNVTRTEYETYLLQK